MIQNSIFNVRKISLILGTACNFNCLYCIQHENKPRCKKQISQKLFDWLDDVAYRLPMKFKPTIHFYGGEPLLYKEAIHEVIDHCGDDFNYLIVTNGAYLTDEDVDYFNAHDVRVALSNDGPNTKITRQVDMFEDEEFLKRFNRLKHKEVDGVVSGVNQDYYAFMAYVEEKAPGASPSFEELVCNEQTDEKLCVFDPAVLLKSYKRMGEELIVSWDSGVQSTGAAVFNKFLKQALHALNNPTFPDFGVCGAGKSNISVDTQGNVYLCKNFNLKIGTVADEYEDLYARAKEETKKLRDAHLDAKGCFDCPAFYFCRGGCPFEKPSKQQKHKCDMLRTKWASVVSFIDNKVDMEITK